jgi:hypothetical protein
MRLRDPFLLRVLGQGRLLLGLGQLELWLGFLDVLGLAAVQIRVAVLARPERRVALVRRHHAGLELGRILDLRGLGDLGHARLAGLQVAQLLGRGPPARDRPAAGLDHARGRVGRRLDHARDGRAREQQHAREEEEHREDVGADAPDQRRGGPVERLAGHPAARAHPVGIPEAGAPAVRAEAERAGGQPEAERGEQAHRARTERPHGREHGPQHEDRAARQQRGGHAVVDGAEQPAQRVERPAAGLAAVDPAVDEEREEDGDRDEPEADQVELALLELGQVGPRGARRGAPGA